jgi:peptidoglycan/LPS O-acetylase OafA/YrhL
MSMVLNDGAYNAHGWPGDFYLSRFLRLFPSYWIVATAALISFLFIDFRLITNENHSSSVFSWILVMSSNYAILGLDVVNMIAKGDYTDHTLIRLVGPAWTLAIEIEFYLIAPFIVTKKLRVCIGILIILLIVRFSIAYFTDQDLWKFYFAPAVWCFFIFGVISHRISARIYDDKVRQVLSVASITVLALYIPVCKPWMEGNIDRLSLWILYILFAACMPFIFAVTKNFALDTAIGNLSYPIYIVHSPLIVGLNAYRGLPLSASSTGEWSIFILSSVLAASVVLRCLVEVPIDRFRSRLKHRGATCAVATRQ